MPRSSPQSAPRTLPPVFVGRAGELAWLDQWLGASQPPTQVALLQGIGGIGKSTLLRRMADKARAAGAAVAILDLEMTGLAPATLLQHLNGQLPAPAAARAAADGHRLIAIDHYDDANRIDDWVRAELLPQCPARGCLIVVASRRGLPDWWRDDPSWARRIRRFPLQPLTDAEARELLGRSGVGASLREADLKALVRAAHGLPLALAVRANNPELPIDAAAVPFGITTRLFREVTDPGLEAVLDALAVLHHADQDLLGACLEQPVSASLYRRTASLPFVTASPGGLRLHEVIREHLQQDLTARAPHRRNRLQHKAVEAIRRRLGDPLSSSDLRRLDGLNLLYLCREAMASALFFTVPGGEGPEYSIGPLRRQEIPVLQDLLESALVDMNQFRDTAEAHQLLEVVVEHLPGSISVLRQGDGGPEAFTAVIPLHRDSLPILSSFALVSNYLAAFTASELAKLRVPPSQADTFLWIGGPAPGTPEQGRPFWPHLLRHTISLLADGGRLVFVTNSAGIVAGAEPLGFRPVPGTARHPSSAPEPLRYLELDLRHGRFAAWALAFLDDHFSRPTESGSTDEPAGHESAAAHSAAPPSPDELMPYLRWVLKNLPRPGAVDRRTVSRLRRILTAGTPFSPLTPELQQLLRVTYLDGSEPHRKAFAIAEELNISRPTYFRRLNEALAALALVWTAES